MICPEAVAVIQPGEPVTVDLGRCVVAAPPASSPSRRCRLHRRIVEAGGLLPMLKKRLPRLPKRQAEVDMPMTTICLIPGDGVGREVVPAAARVLAVIRPGLALSPPRPDGIASSVAEQRCPKRRSRRSPR